MGKIRIAMLLAASVMVGVFSSCSDIMDMRKDESPKVKVTRKVAPFNGIKVNGSADVYYSQGDTVSVVIVGRKATVDNLNAEVRNGELVVEWKDRKLMDKVINKNVDLYVVSPSLDQVVVNGCGDFKVTRRLDVDDLTVALNGTGDITMEGVVCENFNVMHKGTGDIDIKNLACRTSNINLKGTGDIDVRLFDVAQTKVELHGVGDIDLKMQNCGSVFCGLYGVGDIELSGSLRKFEKAGKGIGDIDTDKVRYIK